MGTGQHSEWAADSTLGAVRTGDGLVRMERIGMSDELRHALDALLKGAGEQKRAILLHMLWRIVEQDWHGASDDCNDLRELHL